MIEYLRQPWPWYFSGSIIAGIMVFLLFFGKNFGISSNLRTICVMCGAGKKIKLFQYDWKKASWNLWFLAGTILGGFIAQHFLNNNEPVQIASATIKDLANLGFSPPNSLQPEELFGIEHLLLARNLLLLITGELCIGFGSRWAGGCTSGHAISGLSNLQLPSLIAVIGFFIGGLLATHLIFPLIFK